MIFATIFFACTYATCNGYVIDTAKTESDCYQNMMSPSESFADRWAIKDSGVPLQEWLDKFKISETADELTDYDFTCEPIKEDDIP